MKIDLLNNHMLTLILFNSFGIGDNNFILNTPIYLEFSKSMLDMNQLYNKLKVI